MAQAESDWDRGDIRAAIGPTQKGVDILRPYVQSADGSRRIKLEYAYLLNDLSHSQPAEQAVVTCEEALRILAGLGALDLADLSATSAWANIADTEAREGMTVGRVDEAERLEKQVQIQEARNFYAACAAKPGVLEMNDVWAESVEASSRQTGLAFGEDASVYAMSTKALPRMDHLIAGLTDPDLRATALYWKRQTLEEAARAALNLQRFAEAETAARALLSLHGETGVSSEHVFLDQPEDADWGRVLLAQAATAQGRKAEALQTLEPALAHYRDAQAKGAAHVTFRQHFARALYAEALAEPTDNGGTARSREALGQAVALLQGLTEEATQLHDSKELLSWIAAARKKLNPDAQAKK
jgi:hypothetical protein